MRLFALAAALLTATAGPAIATLHAPVRTPFAAPAVVASSDTTLCAALHTALHGAPGHAAPDSATMAAMHSLMAAHHGEHVTLDSAQMSAIHNVHAQLLHASLDPATHEALKTLMHPAGADGAQADSTHAALHNALMACMQHG